MDEYPPPYVFDVRALCAWAGVTGNESALILAEIGKGNVHIYSRVWKEFCEAFEEESETLPKDKFERLRVLDGHKLQAGAMLDKADGLFKPKGPWDDCTEAIVAGIAGCESGTVVTDAREKPRYEAVDGLAVLTFEEYMATLLDH